MDRPVQVVYHYSNMEECINETIMPQLRELEERVNNLSNLQSPNSYEDFIDIINKLREYRQAPQFYDWLQPIINKELTPQFRWLNAEEISLRNVILHIQQHFNAENIRRKILDNFYSKPHPHISFVGEQNSIVIFPKPIFNTQNISES